MTHKILVIEDFELLRKMYTDILGRFDYDILTAETGTDGFEIAQVEKPDVILLDIDLPYMSGLEILYRLRQLPELSNTRVIIVTGNHNIEDNDFANEADLILLKPVSPTDLVNFVQCLLPTSATA